MVEFDTECRQLLVMTSPKDPNRSLVLWRGLPIGKIEKLELSMTDDRVRVRVVSKFHATSSIGDELRKAGIVVAAGDDHVDEEAADARGIAERPTGDE